MPKCERENTSKENKSIEFVSIFTHEVKSGKAKFILRIIRIRRGGLE